jgi:ribonuclease P protein component
VSCPEGPFPPTSRLTTPADFKAVFAAGRRFSDSQFIILARPNGTQCPRLGFAVARNRIPLAVARNRLKRVVRDYFRTHQDGLGGVDIVVMAQSKATVRDPEALRASLQRHWKKIAPCAIS